MARRFGARSGRLQNDLPDSRRKRCKECGGHTDDVGPLSWRGYCEYDSIKRNVENGHGLHSMNGEAVLRWRRGVAASVGAILIDDLQSDA